MFGYEAAELTGKNVRLLMPSPHREQHARSRARYRESGMPRLLGVGREERLARARAQELERALEERRRAEQEA